MEDILHHLGCNNTLWTRDKLPTSTGAGFQPSTVSNFKTLPRSQNLGVALLMMWRHAVAIWTFSGLLAVAQPGVGWTPMGFCSIQKLHSSWVEWWYLIVILDLFIRWCLLCTMVNHHETTIEENMFTFSKHLKQIQVIYLEPNWCLMVSVCIFVPVGFIGTVYLPTWMVGCLLVN